MPGPEYIVQPGFLADISDDRNVRSALRKLYMKEGFITGTGDPEKESVYSQYYAFRQKLDLLAGLYDKAGTGTAQSDQEALASVLALQGRTGADGAQLRVLTGLSKKRLERAVQGVAQSRLAVAWDRASQGWIGRDGFGELCLQLRVGIGKDDAGAGRHEAQDLLALQGDIPLIGTLIPHGLDGIGDGLPTVEILHEIMERSPP